VSIRVFIQTPARFSKPNVPGRVLLGDVLATLCGVSGKRRSAISLCLLLCVLLGTASCARTLSRPSTTPTAAELRSLWREPVDIARRNLLDGPGGREHAPGPGPFIFVERKQAGTNPGYDVRDREGTVWSVKLGPEAQSEVAVSRILWAIGYHQPANYYVPRWEMTGGPGGLQPAARFRRELPNEEVVGEWSWYDNPFINAREFGGLIAINLLLNNWDLKTANNKIYEGKSAKPSERRYLVRDLGGSLGSSVQPALLRWIPFMRYAQGSRNHLADFEKQGFIESIEGDDVRFVYRGLDNALADRVSVSDLRWAAALLGRLSDRQWLDAFQAAGYTADESRRYVRKIHAKLAEVSRATSARNR
jgi:hypothetical protein